VIARVDLLKKSDKLLNRIKDGKVSATLVMEELKNYSEDELDTLIEEATEKGHTRVTRKHLFKGKEKPAPAFSDKTEAQQMPVASGLADTHYLRDISQKLLERSGGIPHRKEKVEVIELICRHLEEGTPQAELLKQLAEV
jgi:hypothetical protein